MTTRWHHLITYAASRCLPPPQPQLMSTPLSHCLVDCCLSPSLWLTTTIIVVISILHLVAPSFTPLLLCLPTPSSPIFRRGRVLFRHHHHRHQRRTSSPYRPCSPSVSPLHLPAGWRRVTLAHCKHSPFVGGGEWFGSTPKSTLFFSD